MEGAAQLTINGGPMGKVIMEEEIIEKGEEVREEDCEPKQTEFESSAAVRSQPPFDPLLNPSPSDSESGDIVSDVFFDNIQSPKNSRRVSFPQDDRMVVGYMDPPNPWHDAEKCTPEELVQAYRQACEKLNIKPIPKLLSQLQAISNFCDRNETFTLKGEKLDAKHCETLEEILRRVQFRTVDLENTHLEEEGSVALFDMIEYYESCTRLNISMNKNMGIRGWQACSRMLKKTPCVDQLEARSCALTEQMMPLIGRALRMGSQLTVLHLENSILSGRPLMILVTAIKMNEVLRELYLADNKLMPSDGIQLGNMLKFNHRLTLLDVRNNHLQDVGCSHLCDGLSEQNHQQGLTTLVFWNNQITYQSMPSLARALLSSKVLETLNLGHNNITNEGIHRLKEGLLLNKSLMRIGLQASKITCEGAVALAEFIADSRNLLRIDLRENDIKTGGLMALSLALKVSESVTRVDLDKEPKKESGVKDYADQQRRLLQDLMNYMQRNRELARKREEEEEQRLKEEKEQREKQMEEEEEKVNVMVEEVKEAEPEVIAEESDEEKLEKLLQDEEDNEKRDELTELSRSHLKLQLPGSNRAQELESPAFVREADMVFVAPPTEAELAAKAAAVSLEEIPVEFPPSPMVPKAFVGEEYESPRPSVSPNQSPTSKRKFVIEKVRDPLNANSGVGASTEQAEEQIGDATPTTGDSQGAIEESPGSDDSASIPVNAGNESGGTAEQEMSETRGNLKLMSSSEGAEDLFADLQNGVGATAPTQGSGAAEESPPRDGSPESASPSQGEGDNKSHTHAGMNGIKQDLASAMESLDTDFKKGMDIADGSADAPSSPDDFERELDEMLASVQMSSGSSSSIKVDDILLEAAEQS